jgi:hypothetical protein
MNVLVAPVGGKIVESQLDGNVVETDIDVADILLEDVEETISAAWTFNELLTALNGLDLTGALSVLGDVTIDGQLFVVNGNGTEILTEQLKVEDLVATYAVDNPTASVQTGHEFEIGVGVKWAYTRDANGEFRLGLTTDKKLITFIQDNPQEDLILTYDSATKTLINRTNQDILDILNIQISDVEDLGTTLSDLRDDVDDKLEFFGASVNDVVVGGNQFNTLNLTSGATWTQNAGNPNQLDMNIFGAAASGTGKQTIVEVNVDVPLALTGVEQQITFTVKTASDDTDVLEIDDGNDIIILKKTEVDDEDVKYESVIQPQFSNSNGTPQSVDIIFKLDAVEVDRRSVVIAKNSPPDDGTSNAAVLCWTATDPIQATQNLTYHIEGAVGVVLESATIATKSSFVVAANVADLMFTTTYDTDKDGIVDFSHRTQRVMVHTATNPQDADIVINITGGLVDGDRYSIKTPIIVSGANARISIDNEVVFNVVLDRDGITNLIGTDLSDVTFDYDFDGTNFILVSDDLELEALEARIDNINVVVKETLAMPVGPFWDVKYEADVKPEDATPAWVAAGAGTVTISNSVLNVITATGVAQTYTIDDGNVVASNITRFEAKVKVNSNAGTPNQPSQALVIQDGVVGMQVYLETDKISYLDNVGSVQTIFTGDLQTDFRIVRLELNNVNGLDVFVDNVFEGNVAYAGLQASGNNRMRFGDFSSSTEQFTADVEYDYLYYNLDVVANSGGTDWNLVGGIYEQEVTITGLFEIDDSQIVLPKATNINTLTWVTTKFRGNVDRIDDTTIKLFALEPNDEAFDFEFHIIKTKANL